MCIRGDKRSAARVLADRLEPALVELEAADARIEEDREGARAAFFRAALLVTGIP